jgi:hypothetical protein
MDALEKLAEKNRAHKKHIEAERSSLVLILLGLLPFYVDLAYSFIKSDSAFPQTLIFAVISCVGSLCYSYPILAAVDISLFSQKIKAMTLIITQSWFIYFWVFSSLPWVAFIPLIPVYTIVRRQLPKIRAKIENG